LAGDGKDLDILVASRDVYLLRGKVVMLDSNVATAFGTETRQVNQAVSRNPEKFSDDHCFKLTSSEFDHFKSQIGTSSSGWGGRRKPPTVFTVKGVARLATILDTPAALAATDLIIDTFLLVQEQLGRGKRSIAIPEPDRYRVDDEDREAVRRLRKRLAAAVGRLLDTMIDPETEQTLGEASKALGTKALHNIQERLRTKGLENAKLEADSSLVLAQAEKVLADARKARAEADGIDIENFEKRINAVKRVAELIREIEPPEVIELIERFEAEPKLIVDAKRHGGKD
jgi:hypothetical protein